MSPSNLVPHNKTNINNKKPAKKQPIIRDYYFDDSYPRRIKRAPNDLAYLYDLDIQLVIKEIIWPSQRSMDF